MVRNPPTKRRMMRCASRGNARVKLALLKQFQQKIRSLLSRAPLLVLGFQETVLN